MVAIPLNSGAMWMVHHHGVGGRGAVFGRPGTPWFRLPPEERPAAPAAGSRGTGRTLRTLVDFPCGGTLTYRNTRLLHLPTMARSRPIVPLPARATPARPISLRSPAGRRRALAQDRARPHYGVRRHRHGRPRRSVAPAYVRCVPRRMSRPTRARPLRRAALSSHPLIGDQFQSPCPPRIAIDFGKRLRLLEETRRTDRVHTSRTPLPDPQGPA